MNEIERILALPQRDPDMLGAQIAESLTELLKAPGGSMCLRPLQALALVEAHDVGGIVGMMPVGSGKTLVSYLLPTVMKKERPLLLVPGKLKQKTLLEFRDLADHWRKPKNYRIESYEMVSRHPRLLLDHNPDLIVADECHRLKDPKAGCTKRMKNYWMQCEDFAFVPMSGTMINRSFREWWLLQMMALPEDLFVLPRRYHEMSGWAETLDTREKNPRPLDKLSAFGSTRKKAREGYGSHIRRVPGIIAAKSVDIDASLRIETHKIKIAEIQEEIQKLEKTWSLPNGSEFCEAVDLWRHSCELSQGFYYEWAEEPPAEWLATRASANKFVRDKLKRTRKFETPGQIFSAFKDELPIKKWAEIKNTYRIKTRPVWVTKALMHSAVDWATANKGLVWVAHRAVGECLETLGIPYFHSHGKTSQRKSIMDHDGAAAVSIDAVSEGFNLQKWSCNLVLSCPANGARWEQLIGRTHRSGQSADFVNFELWFAALVQMRNFKKAVQDAEYIQQITGQAQKLCYADKIGE